MVRRHAFAALVLSMLALGSCHMFDKIPLVCPDIAVPGLAAAVRDSVSGVFIAAGAKVVAHAGTYADSATGFVGDDAQPIQLQPRRHVHRRGVKVRLCRLDEG